MEAVGVVGLGLGGRPCLRSVGTGQKGRPADRSSLIEKDRVGGRGG